MPGGKGYQLKPRLRPGVESYATLANKTVCLVACLGAFSFFFVSVFVSVFFRLQAYGPSRRRV